MSQTSVGRVRWSMSLTSFTLGLRRIHTLAVLLVALVAGLLAPAAEAAKRRPVQVSVMSRNLNLGADLELGVRATSLQGLVNVAATILHQVDENNFPVRAKGLAAEILAKNPDLVGLQEAALWRTGPCNENPIPPKASHVRYDYVKLLLGQLNKGKKRYRVVISENEFDFEVPINLDHNDKTHGSGCPLGSEINGRLTMRDVILARVGGGVTTTNATGDHFSTLLQVRPGGVPINVTRGWTRADVKVRGSREFRFVDAHLEAFDNQPANHRNNGGDVGNGEIREAQAKELVGTGGPASGKLPVILVGDLNSDVKTEVKPGDALAYKAVLHAGFLERSTSANGCCLRGETLKVSSGNKRSQFDHRVDHVMTDAPRLIKLISSSLTGLRPVNGYWDSDHAGLFSALNVF